MAGFERQYDWDSMKEWVIAHNNSMSNEQMAQVIGCSITAISQYRCKLGMSKLKLEKWTPLQVEWLKRLYTHIGDLEIALIFDEAYPKEKQWTLKHIEKKRNYLGLHRTKEQLRAIKMRNKAFGCWLVGSEHSWATRGKAQEGTIKQWGPYKYIKQRRGYERLMIHTWLQHHKSIPKGKVIVRINQALPEDDISNLEAITREELAKRNSFHRYPIELKRNIITLNKLNNRILNLKKQHNEK